MSIEALLEEISGSGRGRRSGQDESYRSTPPDVLCTTLTEVADRYISPCEFKVGDLITPRAGYNTKGAGEPFIVVEVFDKPIRALAPVENVDDLGSHLFGAKIDIRVAHEMKGDLIMHVGESWTYEPYKPA
jgi:hypothetical protein